MPRPFVSEYGIELIQSADCSIYGKYGYKTDEYNNPQAYAQISLARRKKPWKEYGLVQGLKDLRIFHGDNRTPCRIKDNKPGKDYGKFSGCKKTPDGFHVKKYDIGLGQLCQ